MHEQGLRKRSPSPSGKEPSLLVAQGSFGDLLPAMNDDMGDIYHLSPPAPSALDSTQQQVGTRPTRLVSCRRMYGYAHTHTPNLGNTKWGESQTSAFVHRRPQLLHALCRSPHLSHCLGCGISYVRCVWEEGGLLRTQPSHTLQQGLKHPGEASGSGVPMWGPGAPAVGARSGGIAGVSREALLEKLGDMLLCIHQASSQLDLHGLQTTNLSVQRVLLRYSVAVQPPNHPGDANAAPMPPQPPGS